MNLLQKVSIFTLCVLLPLVAMADAAYERLFTPGGVGTIPEKLVVTDDNAVLFKSFSEAPVQIDPLSIFWRLNVEKCSNPKDPVVEHDGKQYYCVGGPTGEQWGYIETTKVTKWMTRFVFAPLPPKDDNVFCVFSKSYSKKEYESKSNDELEKDTVASIKTVPLVGFASFAFILNDAQGKNTGDTDPNAFKSVLIYNTGKSSSSSTKKTTAQDIGLDIVFVVDTTGSMRDMIDQAIKVCKQISDEVKKTSGDKVHFGLVEYRDSEADDFGARLVCDLTEDYDTFLTKLQKLTVNGGGDDPEDVVLGLKTAVDKAKWNKTTSKHIILIGDAPNKATDQAGAIQNFKLLYDYTNIDIGKNSQAMKRIIFHSIVGGEDRNTAEEFQTVAENNGEVNGYFGNMSTNDDVALELAELLSNGITAVDETKKDVDADKGVIYDAVWALKEGVGQDGSKVAVKKAIGFSCARTNKDVKSAELTILVLQDEMKDFEDSLNQAYKRLSKLMAGHGGNVKVIFDQFLEDYVGITIGTATESDYEMSLVKILNLQMPVKTKTLNMSLKDVMKMNDKARQKWMDDIKSARDRAKAILDKKEAWTETTHGGTGETQRYAFIPVADLP